MINMERKDLEMGLKLKDLEISLTFLEWVVEEDKMQVERKK